MLVFGEMVASEMAGASEGCSEHELVGDWFEVEVRGDVASGAGRMP